MSFGKFWKCGESNAKFRRNREAVKQRSLKRIHIVELCIFFISNMIYQGPDCSEF